MTREEFKEIFESHFDSVRNYIYYRSGDQELATDVAQETFLKLWEKSASLYGENLKALLFKISGDIMITHLRKREVALRYRVSLSNGDFGESPEEVLRFEELRRGYELALEKLPEKQRTVFLLSRMDGLKYNEIAEALGLSQKAVEKRMSLALEFLRKQLGQQ